MSGTAAKVYVPDGGALLVAHKGSVSDLAEEDLKAGYVDLVSIACHKYFGTEYEEFVSTQIRLKQPFDQIYPEGSREALAKDAVEALYGNTAFKLLD